jgi:hypothetical protein
VRGEYSSQNSSELDWGQAQRWETKTSSHCQFITTEPLEKSGEIGEHKAWDAVRDAFAQRDCIGYWRYPIFSKVGKSRKEPDILIADSELGLIVIEIKSVTIDQIVAIAGHRWQFQHYYTISSNPYEQAENQLFALLGYCDREPSLRRKVSGRALVCLPLITEDQWYHSGFYQLPSCPPIIFQNHLRPSVSICGSLIKQIQQTTPIIKGFNLTPKQWKLLQAVISGTPVFRKRVGAKAFVPLQYRQQPSKPVPVSLPRCGNAYRNLTYNKNTSAKKFPQDRNGYEALLGQVKPCCCARKPLTCT